MILQLKMFLSFLFLPEILFIFLACCIILMGYNILIENRHLRPIFIKVLPLLLISINFLLFFSNINIYFSAKLSLFLIIHCFVVLPLLIFWTKLYRKDNLDLASIQNMFRFQIPEIYLQLSLSIICPLLFGLYFSLFRYFRLGQILDLSYIFLSDYFVVALFLFPYIFLWSCIFLFFIKSIVIELWGYTFNFFYTLHLKMLQNGLYFLIMKYFHKIQFIFFELFVNNYGSFKYSPGKLRKVSYYVTQIFKLSPIILFSVIFLEFVIFHGKFYFSLYLLFIYPLIMMIYRLVISDFFFFFFEDVCKSDYLIQNFKHPKYYNKFFSSINIFSNTFKSEYHNIISRESLRYYKIKLKAKSLLQRTWGYKLHILNLHPVKTNLVLVHSKKSWNIRLAASYYAFHGVRWFSTTSILYAPGQLHTATALFHKTNPYNLLALIGHPGQNFGLIQKLSKKISWPNANTLYGAIPNSYGRNQVLTFENVDAYYSSNKYIYFKNDRKRFIY